MSLNRAQFHYRWSLASRVTILASVAVGITVAVVAGAAYLFVRQQSVHALDESLRARALTVAHSNLQYYLQNQTAPLWQYDAASVKIALIETAGGARSTTNGGGSTSDTRLPVGAPELRVARGKASYSARTVAVDGQPYRMVTIRTGIKGEALAFAQSFAPTQQVLDRLGLVMLLLGLAGMIGAGLGGWAVARNGLRPVRRLRAAAEDIARTERLEPIRVEGNDEVARLAVAFNHMLNSLAASQVRQRQLVADASHELRTPLTSLRTNLDLLIQADRSTGLSPDARRELMDDVRAQIDEMTTLIGDLVELARDEQRTTEPVTVNLADVVDNALARVRRRSTTVAFDVRTEPWWLVGDATTLERAVTNLLDNAVKWSPGEGTVTVRLREGTLLVTDQGGGIADHDLPHVFDRFYRSAESRAMPGSGLGLSIVRAVAERHGGGVGAGRADGGGAAFWFRVPGNAQAPAEDTSVPA